MNLFFILMGLFAFLFLLFIVFLVVLAASQGGNSQFLSIIGAEATQVKPLLQFIIGLSFGLFSFAALIVLLVGLFRRFTATPAEIDKKRQSVIMAVIAGVLLTGLLFFWAGLSYYISQLQFSTQGAAVISTDPEVTIDLTAPVTITFSANQIAALYQLEGVVAYTWDLDGDKSFNDGTGSDLIWTYDDKGKSNGIINAGVKVTLKSGEVREVTKLITISNVLPTPVVEYSPKVLEVPLQVSFDASKSTDDGSIIAYEWDFDGDGVIDEKGAKVSWSFESTGTQEISLKVTDNNSAMNSKKETLEFKAAKEKKAIIVVRPGLKGEAPYKVSLDASSSSIDDRIQFYEWNFGDNSPPLQGRVIEHTYTSAGEYTVSLMVRGAEGDSFNAEAQIVVERPTNGPTAVIKTKDQQIIAGVLKGAAPLTVSFDASDSRDRDGKVIEYDWDFDSDGTRDAVGEKVEHTFVEGKSYDVTLTVIDDDNLSGTAKLTVDVKTPELVIDLQVTNATGPVPLETTFDASASRADEGKIISYTWNFGDKSPEIIGSARQNHIYNDVGEYTAKVSVLTDKGKRASKEIIVVAREIELLADFTVNPKELIAGEKVFFNGEPSQGQVSSYYWEFGDGTISRVVKPDHVYQQPGTYTVKLEIYDRKSRVSRKEMTLVIE
jgi:PKD repeat protein